MNSKAQQKFNKVRQVFNDAIVILTKPMEALEVIDAKAGAKEFAKVIKAIERADEKLGKATTSAQFNKILDAYPVVDDINSEVSALHDLGYSTKVIDKATQAVNDCYTTVEEIVTLVGNDEDKVAAQKQAAKDKAAAKKAKAQARKPKKAVTKPAPAPTPAPQVANADSEDEDAYA